MTVAAGAGALTGTVASDPTVRFAFSGVADGNMSLAVGPADVAARPHLAHALGVDARDLVFMRQVHRGDVAVVTAAHRGRGVRAQADAIPDVDALVTFEADVPLVVLVADCVPVVVVDSGRSVGVVHAGRSGVLHEVVRATLDVMAPTAPDAVRAFLGPAIGGCCYEVEVEVAETITATVPAARATTTQGTTALDLPAAVTAQLRAAGVTDVRHVGGCTRCDGRRWFSHRRQPEAGRQAAAVVRHGRMPVGAP